MQPVLKFWFKIFDVALNFGRKLPLTNTFEVNNKNNRLTERYSEPYQTSKMELFVKVAIGWKPLIILTKNSVIDVWQACEYGSGLTVWVFSKLT